MKLRKFLWMLGVVILIATGWCLRWNPKISVSVIVPVYNSEKYLARCLDSLKRQKLEDIEFIIVNDGAIDKSLKIAEEYVKQDKRFRVISQENGGVGVARNRGLKEAKGEYVGFVDSDDFVSENYFLELYKKAKKWDADVSVALNVFELSGRVVEQKWRPVFAYRDKEFLEDFSFLIRDAGEQWDKIYKKSFLMENRISSIEERLWFEDVWFSTLIAIYAKRVAISKKGVYFYRIHDESLSAVRFMEEKDFWRGLDLHREFFVRIKDLKISDEDKMKLKIILREKIYWFIGTYMKRFSDVKKLKEYYNSFGGLI